MRNHPARQGRDRGSLFRVPGKGEWVVGTCSLRDEGGGAVVSLHVRWGIGDSGGKWCGHVSEMWASAGELRRAE